MKVGILLYLLFFFHDIIYLEMISMTFIQENKITLNIGLKKEYSLIHFSDVHVVAYDNDSSESEITRAINSEAAWISNRMNFAKHFNEICNPEHLISSKECLEEIIKYINKVKPNCALLSGDIIDYYSESNFRYIKKALKRINTNYIFSCGNHEAPASLFDEICNNNVEINYIDFDEFLIVSLDDSSKLFTLNQINKLKELLKLSKPIILLMHIPLLTKYNESEMSKYESYYVIDYKTCDEITLEFIDLVCGNDLIKAIFCGHVHGSHRSFFAENKLQICASSGLIGYVNNITLI